MICLWSRIRNLIAFWFFGLLNNFTYVIMLSAAVDILEQGDPKALPVVTNDTVIINPANCTQMGTGAVLLADIGPGLLIKLMAPCFITKMHFHAKVGLSVAFAASSFILVSVSNSVGWSLFGVILASLACGLGDVTFLTMISFFDSDAISAWSSGTGAAGVVGSLLYAGLTSFLSPQVTLQVTLFAPFTLLAVYIFILDKSQNSVFQLPSWCCCRQRSHHQFIPLVNVDADESEDEEIDERLELVPPSTEQPAEEVQVSPSWYEKRRIIRLLLPLMTYVSVVYFFEYLINQALFELIIFGNTSLTHEQQYRWFQVLYQCGVFLSRSSVKFFKIKQTWVLAVLQFANFLLFLGHVMRPFIPSIWIVFTLIAYEGILGGLSYVNTFYRIITESEPTHREFSMSVAAFSDALGITMAALLAIPLHNWLCR